ncbi:MAG: signal peptidase I [Candidatus Pacebacteria bacterium]|nr:signal peptidase I [Candidatus Paceibacterota bacterium]
MNQTLPPHLQKHTSRKKQPKPVSGVVEFVKSILYALVIVFLVRSFGFEPFNIPSSSMVPTLVVGDYLFVSKFSYGYSRYSLPFGIKFWDGRILASEPKRGDVAVFKWPGDNKTDYIKRIIALPGDTIELRDGRVWINGQIVERRLLPNEQGKRLDPVTGRLVYRYEESLPGGSTHLIEQYGDYEINQNFPRQCPAGQVHCPITLPADSYFVMGDNRDNSADSRISSDNRGVGILPRDNLVGKAQVVFLSLDNASLWEVWKLPFAVRWSRIFSWIR